MAKVVFSLVLVNGTGPSDREIGAHELLRMFVSDDTRPPQRNVNLAVYTDDGHMVDIGIPSDGIGEIRASVSPWNGEKPRATRPSRLMRRMMKPNIVELIGEPESVGSADEPFGGEDLWPCGCSARPSLSYDRQEPREEVIFEWVQCDRHVSQGEGPLRSAPQTFRPQERQ